MTFTLIDFLQQEYAFSIIILIIILICIILIEIFRKKVFIFFKKSTHVGKLKLMKLEFPAIMLFFVFGTQIVLIKVLKQHSIDSDIGKITTTIIIMILAYILMIISGLIIDSWSNHLNKIRRDDTHEEIIPLAKSITNIILSLIALVFILQTWAVAVGTLLASLGVAGLILGFAFKDALTNIFGGILLIIDNSFRKGDLIELPDGEIGYVEETNLRSTKIKNFDNQEVIIPNGVLVNLKIKNYAHPSKAIRIKIFVPIDYGADIKKAESLVFSILSKRKEILRYPKPSILLDKIGEYALELRVLFYINDYHELFKMRSEITKEIFITFKKKGIKVPYPSRTIHLNKN